MIIRNKDLEFDEDFKLERAKELDLLQLKLDLPYGLIVTGFSKDNRILIRREEKLNSSECKI